METEFLPNLRFKRFSMVRRCFGTAHRIPSPIMSLRERDEVWLGILSYVVGIPANANAKTCNKDSQVVLYLYISLYIPLAGGIEPRGNIAGSRDSSRCKKFETYNTRLRDILIKFFKEY